MVQLQDSISKRLHHHTFSNMFSNKIFKAHRVQILSCSGPRTNTWLTVPPLFPTFQLFSPIFSIALCMRFGLHHLLITSILWCMCTHLINLMDIHFLHCTHGNEHIGTHDAIHHTFAAIVRNVNFHMGWQLLHLLLSTTFHSFCQQINIVFTKNGIHTLTDVVIADPMWVDLLPQSCETQRFVTFDAIQTQEKNYRNWHLTD
jgi:hypothetical protein